MPDFCCVCFFFLVLLCGFPFSLPFFAEEMQTRRPCNPIGCNTGFLHLLVLAIYQFARVPPKSSHIIVQKKALSVNPKPGLKTKKRSSPQLERDFDQKRRSSPQFEWDFVHESSQYGVNVSTLKFKHLSSDYNVPLEMSKCTLTWEPLL